MKIKDKKMLCVFGIVVIAFFGMFFRMNYSVDTYLLFASKDLNYVQQYINSGRVFTAFLFKFLQFLTFSPEAMYLVSFIIGIICATLSIYTLYCIFKEYTENKVSSAIISTMIVINPLIIELWLFAEMGIMMLSILTCILAYKHFDKYLETHKFKEVLFCIIFMIIAMFSYQGTVAIFIALSAISIIINCDNIRKFIVSTIISFICYIIPVIINFGFIMMLGNNRVSMENTMIQKINFIIMATKEQLFKGFGLYPSTLFIAIHIVALAMVIVFTFLSNDNLKRKMYKILKIIYLIFITYFFTILTIIPQNINSIVMFPRNCYAYGSIIGLIFALDMINGREIKYKEKLIAVIALLLLVMEFVQFTSIGINRYIVNYMDKYVILEIDDKIKKYEESTGNKVENISIYNMKNSNKFYDGLSDSINVSAKNEEMSGRAIRMLFTHRELKEVPEKEEIYKRYFKNNNWDRFSLDQIVLEGNTIHWYLY